jgi:predicted permease
MRDALTNPLDLDTRAMAMVLGIAAATWFLTSLPGIWRVSRASVVDGLRDDPRVMPVTRGAARLRQVLMTAQVALTVLLLVGGLLYIQTYAALVGRDKGFDASRLATIQILQTPDADRPAADVEHDVLDRLRSLPGVQSASRTGSLLPSTQSGAIAPLTINGGTPTSEWVMIHFIDADPDYFSTMGIQVVQGRLYGPGSPRDEVIIDERFAQTHWPGRSAVGTRFKLGDTGHGGIWEYRIVGVSRQLRTDRLVRDTGESVFVAYIAFSPTYHPLTFVARLDDERRLSGIGSAIQTAAGRAVVRVDTVEARYARLNADSRLAAVITSGFSAVAFLVAVTGVYAVMAYLVSGRRREIGIRMALGADRGSILRLVLSSALGSVAIGIGVGLAAAVLAAQTIASQLFGVTAADPRTYTTVAGAVALAAAAATWWPARRAARIDPALTLRSE